MGAIGSLRSGSEAKQPPARQTLLYYELATQAASFDQRVEVTRKSRKGEEPIDSVGWQMTHPDSMILDRYHIMIGMRELPK